MNEEDAKKWLEGKMSTVNIIGQDPIDTWELRVAQADAAMMKQAFFMLKAKKEGLINE